MEELRKQTSNEKTKKERNEISEEGRKEGCLRSWVDEGLI
jgi:hypothetical protein